MPGVGTSTFAGGFRNVTPGGSGRTGIGNSSRPAGTSGAAATKVALGYKNAMGLPNFQDLFKDLSGKGLGGATIGGLYDSTEYGNRDELKKGAGRAWGEVSDWKNRLAEGKAQLAKVRGGIENPTGTEGFKNVMRLTDARLNRASQASAQQAADAATRRGFVGGYNPGRTDRDRLEAMAMAGWEGADHERAAQMQQFQNESSVYGADVGGYKSAVDAWNGLINTYGTTPTKVQSSNLQANPMLDVYSKLLGGLSGGFGDIFGTSLRSVEFDANRPSSLQAEQFALQEKARHDQAALDQGMRHDQYALEQETAQEAEKRRRLANQFDSRTPAAQLAARREEAAFKTQQQKDLSRVENGIRYDKHGMPYGSAHPYGS